MRNSNPKTENKAVSRWSAWRYEDRTPVKLCKGVEIDESVYDISENRYFSLILKGFVVYLITAGGIGMYLTALEIDFNQFVMNFFVFITAILCAILYHSWKSENLGYLGFFAVYASIMILFRDYINSGFYAILNDTIDQASIYFDTEGLQYYNERITNRYVAITIAVTIIGVAINILLNNYILRRARYIIAIVISISASIACFYMELEPATVYVIMNLAGIFMTFMLRSGGHFILSRRDHIFGKSKRGLTYLLDYKSLWQGIVIALIYVMTVVTIMSTVFDKKSFDIVTPENEKKEASREVMQNVIMLGIFGLIDYYPNNGGLSTGELGGVSSIRLDYQPDIAVIFTPYTYDTLYIRNFIGVEYMPFQNKWYQNQYEVTEDGEYKSYIKESGYIDEVEALKASFEEGDEYSARGIMTVTNIEAPALPYQPYYSDSDRKPVFYRKSDTYTYYPRFNETTATVSSDGVSDDFLAVPSTNKQAVDDFIERANIHDGTPIEIANQIADYYQENVPYTIRPGATPWRRDFVNYFLNDNQKGYCAHFASAAVLILREMGVPARYCEGYAISYNQIVRDGELLEDSEYANYYEGYNALGETAVVRVEATDADAHAWVEIYDEEMGWIPVEVTPTNGLDEEEDENFWDAFNNIFGDGEDANGNLDNDAANADFSGADRVMRVFAFVVLGIIAFVGLGIAFLKFWPEINYRIQYNKAGTSDKLILKYMRFIRKKRKKDEGLRTKMNYNEQMHYLLPYSKERRDRMIDILERAGFSKREINDADYQYADQTIEELSGKKKT